MKSFFSKGSVFAAGAAAASILFLANTGLAHADSSPACGIDNSGFQKIEAIQNDPNLSYLDEVKAELAVRKDLLGQTIDCGKKEVDMLTVGLSKAPVDGTTKNLKDAIAGKLNDAQNFYDIENAKVGGVGISGSQAIAKELLAWREGSLDPLSGEVNNFVLWTKNQDLFATAQSRMDDTDHAVKFIENATPNDELTNELNAAHASFAGAQEKNAEAYAALSQFESADQSLALIKQSLDSLSDAYQHFSNIGDIIKKILPQ